jgi:hypothetical protein
MFSLVLAWLLREAMPTLPYLHAAVDLPQFLQRRKLAIFPAALDELHYKDAESITPGSDSKSQRCRSLAFAISCMYDDKSLLHDAFSPPRKVI